MALPGATEVGNRHGGAPELLSGWKGNLASRSVWPRTVEQTGGQAAFEVGCQQGSELSVWEKAMWKALVSRYAGHLGPKDSLHYGDSGRILNEGPCLRSGFRH